MEANLRELLNSVYLVSTRTDDFSNLGYHITKNLVIYTIHHALLLGW
jgi:hypothetical protein